MEQMATLYVRNVPPELYSQVKRWAAAAGRSVNAEIVEVLEREAQRRERDRDWYRQLLELRRELALSPEDADLAIAAIRAHRDGADRVGTS
jgi:plasmid stability protein